MSRQHLIVVSRLITAERLPQLRDARVALRIDSNMYVFIGSDSINKYALKRHARDARRLNEIRIFTYLLLIVHLWQPRRDRYSLRVYLIQYIYVLYTKQMYCRERLEITRKTTGPNGVENDAYAKVKI